MIKLCNGCKPHEFQDKKYGQNMRVHTDSPTSKAKRCTVCGKESDTGGGKK